MNKISYETRKNLYMEYICHYGSLKQAGVAIEEMSELTKELSKNIFRGEQNREQIVDELADVTIMLEQLRLIYEVNDDVCEHMDAKIERMYERLHKTAPINARERRERVQELKNAGEH